MGVNGIYGLSGSGLDIESMVKVGMMSKQSEYEKMAQKYTKNEWTKAAYLEISNQITTFNMSTLSDYKMSSSMNAKTTTSSNENAVIATANATAANMNHKVSVDSLSSNAYLISKKNAISDIVSDNGGVSTSIKLKDILFKGLDNDTSGSTDTQTYSGGTTVTKTTFSGNSNVSIATTQADNGNLVSSAKNGNVALEVTKDSGGTHYKISDGTNTATVNYNNGRFTYESLTGESVSINVSFSGSSQQFAMSDGVTFSRNLSNGTSAISFSLSGSNTTFTVDTDYNTITDVSNGSATYSATGGNATTTYETTFSGGKKITLTEDSNGKYTYSDGTNTYTEGTMSTDANGVKTVTFGSVGSNYYGKVTLNEGFASNTADSTITVETQKSGITGTTISGTELGTFFNNVSLNDTAMAFKIGDGTNTTDTISYTYADLLDGGKTINDLVSDINTKATSSGLNVKASYDVANDIFSLYNSKGGNENQILITAVGGIDTTSSANSYGAQNLAGNAAKDFFNALGLKQSTGDSLKAPSAVSANANLLSGNDDADHLTITNLNVAEGVAGTNGKITVDGVEYDNITDNKITVGGVTYSALNKTTEPTTVSITQDTNGIVDKVKSFVENYNKILSSLYEKYDEKSDSAYKPLTQAQKDTMKEEQIEKWEEKAKKGLLYHDQTLSKIINQMRSAISQSVEGVNGDYTSAYSIGISTTGIKGQLVLDETKLKNALAADSDSVYNVFAKLDSKAKTDSTTGVVKENGIAQRLGDIFTTATKSIKSRAGSTTDITEDSELNNLLRELQTKMSNFKKLMTSFEDRLYKKYDAMEATLAKLGSQLSFITGAQG